MRDYEVTLVSSTKELKGKALVMAKQFTEAIPLAKEVQSVGEVTIDVDYLAEFQVHNERSDNKDYVIYVICDKDGTKYSTSSQSLFDSAVDCIVSMDGMDEEWKLRVFGMKSKNFAGDFLTATIV